MVPRPDPAHDAVMAFQDIYDYPPRGLYRAPGRVNLIGDHTDYNDGFVLPMAIDRAVYVAASLRQDRQVRVLAQSLGQDAFHTFALDGLEPVRDARWSNYVRGVLALLEQGGHTLCGMDLVYAGDVPIGAGLSSSAAVEVAVATAACHLHNLNLTGVEIARLAQQAEHQFAGTQCGLMDQLISVLGKQDHALLIDCRHVTTQPVPLAQDLSIVVCDTNKRRGLVDSAYNERRAQCYEGARLLGVPALRDLDPAAFERQADRLPTLLARRCRHVVHENERTLQAAQALRQGDIPAVGLLMNRSHTSLRDLYEVSCDELDLMAALAQAQPGCWGARMTGAGFGGCVVALVDKDTLPAFVDTLARLYESQSLRTPALYVTQASAGAGPVG